MNSTVLNCKYSEAEVANVNDSPANPISFTRRILTRILRIGIVIYLVGTLLMVFFEERLIFFPTRYPNGGNWDAVEENCEDVFFQTEDGVTLHGWFFEHPAPRNYVIYFHGNADYVANLGRTGGLWRELLDASVLVFDYRGYGRSDDQLANEQGVVLDGKAARSWMSKRASVEPAEIILVGRSLGGGVAVAVAADQNAKALILQSTFSSLADTAAKHFPFLPVHWIMRNRFDSCDLIRAYSGPVFQSHGTTDEIIPIELAQKLHAVIPGQKKLFLIKRGRHNDEEPPEYYDELTSFLSEVHAVRSEN